jgi:hypothetical protein
LIAGTECTDGDARVADRLRGAGDALGCTRSASIGVGEVLGGNAAQAMILIVDAVQTVI